MSEYEKLKKQLKPDFEDMVPWYSGTSTDLFKTVFDLMVSVTLFVGRFDMRMMQVCDLLKLKLVPHFLFLFWLLVFSFSLSREVMIPSSLFFSHYVSC
jgi:hypothetical protein